MFNPNAEVSFEQIPEGVYAGRCSRIVELGTQGSELYEPSKKAQIWINVPSQIVEINGEKKQAMIGNVFGIPMKNGDRAKMKEYTNALDPKKQGTNLGFMLDQPCQITVRHSDKGRAYIDAIAPILPGTEVPAVDIPLLWFRQDQPDPEIWQEIPEFTQNLIKEAIDYQGSLTERMVNELENPANAEF